MEKGAAPQRKLGNEDGPQSGRNAVMWLTLSRDRMWFDSLRRVVGLFVRIAREKRWLGNHIAELKVLNERSGTG